MNIDKLNIRAKVPARICPKYKNATKHISLFLNGAEAWMVDPSMIRFV